MELALVNVYNDNNRANFLFNGYVWLLTVQ